MKKCITVIILLLAFSLVDLYAQNKSSPYISLVFLSKICAGYEYRLSNRWAVSAEVGYVPAVTKSFYDSDFFSTPIRMLNTKGIQTLFTITLYSKNYHNLLSIRTEFDYERSNLYSAYSSLIPSTSSYEYKDSYMNYGIMFSFAHRYNTSGRFCLVFNLGIKYQTIKRHYVDQYHFESNKIENLNKYWPIANIGLRFYFRKLN